MTCRIEDYKLKNADNAFLSITDANDTWTDSLRYKQQPRWNTYGRFPDGGNYLAMFERPTIESSNRICISTVMEESLAPSDSVTQPIPDGTNAPVASVRYYNLNGLQISNVREGQIVIEKIQYGDGQTRLRKVCFGSSKTAPLMHDTYFK